MKNLFVGLVLASCAMFVGCKCDNGPPPENLDNRVDMPFKAWKHAKDGKQVSVFVEGVKFNGNEKVNIYLFSGRDKKFVAAVSPGQVDPSVPLIVSDFKFSVHPILASFARPPYPDSKVLVETKDGKEVEIKNWSFELK